MDWLTENVLGDWIAQALKSILLSATVTAWLGWLKAKAKPWASHVLYALVCFTCTLYLFNNISARLAQMTPENAEKRVKEWLEHTGQPVAPRNSPDHRFYYVISVGRHGGYNIYLPDRPPNNIYVIVEFHVPPYHLDHPMLNKLSESEMQIFRESIIQEATRMHIAVTTNTVGRSFEAIFRNRVPLSNLTEDKLLNSIDDLGDTMTLLEISLNRQIRQIMERDGSSPMH